MPRYASMTRCFPGPRPSGALAPGIRRARRLLVLAMLLVASVRPAWATAEPLSGREIALKVLPSVALVVVELPAEAGARRATAFFVSPTVLATSAHVVADARRIGVVLAGEKTPRLVRVIAQDPASDLALLALTTSSPDGPALELAQDGGIAVGDRVYVAGNPLGLKGSLSEGLLSAVRGGPGNPVYQISAPISSGSSGGPVLNEAGQVVGVVKATVTRGQNLNFAVPVAALRSLIAKAEPGQSARAEGETPLRDVAGWQTARWGMSPAEVKAALLLIDCPRAKPRSATGLLYTAFVLPTEIGGIEYRVGLDFDTARGTLEQVRFAPKATGAARAAFESLRTLLAEKYGTPAEVRRHAADAQLHWAFPSTVIRLRWARRPSDEDGPGLMLLAYQSRRLFERPLSGEGSRRIEDLDKL
jgi:hypothetical protein